MLCIKCMISYKHIKSYKIGVNMDFFKYNVKKPKAKRFVQEYLPWSYIDTDTNIVHCRCGDMMVCYRFRGHDTDSITVEELKKYNDSINHVLMNMPTGFTLFFDAQRKVSKDYEKSEMPNAILQMMEDERNEYYQSQAHFDSEFYITLYYETPSQLVSKIESAFIQNRKNNDSDNLKVYTETQKKFIAKANEFIDALEHIFPDIELLTAEETIAYLHSCVSDKNYPIKLDPYRFLYDYLADTNFLGGREPKLGDEHLRIITILNFRPMSYPGLFDEFNKLNFEYRWVSRFECKSKIDAQKEIKNYESLWSQQIKSLLDYAREAFSKGHESTPDETAIINKNDASHAAYELSNDETGFGFYKMTMIVKDKDRTAVNDKANIILQIIQSLGFTAFIEKDNCVASWISAIPGGADVNPRRPLISTLNFCHLAPLQAIWSGDKRNKHLKGPVLLYTDTIGCTPFRLNLHVGDLGHTMVVGPSGAGKSVFLNTLEAHFTKYKDYKVFIFDKSMSSRALTLAVNGNFYNLAAEGSNELSFQPLAKIDDENEINWAQGWIIGYLNSRGVSPTPVQINHIWNALKSLKTFPEEMRTISLFCNTIQDLSIRETLKQLTKTGSYGKLFDNDKDIAGNGQWQVFEMEALMNTPAIVPTTLEYLFHRIEKSLKESGGPSIIVLDECWLFFDNPAFKDKLREYFKDMRKKNTSIIFATQNLSDIANKPELMTTIMENCPSRVYLPNANAINEQNKILYKSFGLNEREIDLIASIIPKQDYYYSSQKGNRVFQLSLKPSELPFVTATAKTDQLAIDKIIKEGHRDDFIQYWLQFKEAPAVWTKYKINYLKK